MICKLIKDKETISYILSDIANFARFVKPSNFIKVAKLIVSQWNEKHKKINGATEFIKYCNYWLDPKRRGWYDNYVQHTPCRNNALESTKRMVQ